MMNVRVCMFFWEILLQDLARAMMKTLNQNEVPGGEAPIAWSMAQSMDESQTDCSGMSK